MFKSYKLSVHNSNKHDLIYSTVFFAAKKCFCSLLPNMNNASFYCKQFFLISMQSPHLPLFTCHLIERLFMILDLSFSQQTVSSMVNLCCSVQQSEFQRIGFRRDDQIGHWARDPVQNVAGFWYIIVSWILCELNVAQDPKPRWFSGNWTVNYF